MERREFFRKLIQGTAAIAVAPALFEQIAEAEYKVDEHVIEPEVLFDAGEGFWVFRDEKLIAFSALHGLSFSMEREVFEKPYFSWEHQPSYKEYLPGLMSADWKVENLIVRNHEEMFNSDDPVQIICVDRNGYRMDCEAILTEMSVSARMDEPIQTYAKFILSGPLIYDSEAMQVLTQINLTQAPHAKGLLNGRV